MCLAHASAPIPGEPPAARREHPALQPSRGLTAIRSPGSTRTSRRKLWDIPHKHHCPIIGTCLDVEELRRIAARSGVRAERRLDDYEVHVSFVSAADERNALSLACHKALERKYGAEVRRFARASGPELPALWDQARREGRVASALWALMSDPRADDDLQRRAYEEVHMLSHQVGAGLLAEAGALAAARDEAARLRTEAGAEARRSERRIRERDERIAALTREAERARALEAELAEARRRLARLESGAEITDLRRQLARVEPRLLELEHRAHQATLRAERWRSRYEAQRQALRGAQTSVSGEPPPSEPPTPAVPSADGGGCACPTASACAECPDLAGRRVLCIGGRGALAEHYRALVDRCNGRFARHDGGIEDNPQRLAAMLAAADAVVCPADCVSHDAYHRAKRFCKRTGKPCILLRSSGVVAFTQALRAVAA